MKHVYKSGGDRVSPRGDNYTIKVVNNDDFYDYLANGWFASLEDAISIEGVLEEGSDYEAELREKIKALGGKAGGRSSIETLEKQLKELEDGSDN
ncbi:MAG: hypothetical protein AAGJ57_06640 [Pseudomonadota bacterium]